MFSKNLKRAIVLCGLLCAIGVLAGEPEKIPIKISSRPLHEGRISPMLFGNFMELLDDLVPSMWAEMLNDGSFEGVLPRATWCYATGEPNFCDREWETNATWSYEGEQAFNGARCVKLSGTKNHHSSLTQSGLATKKGLACQFSGYFRCDDPGLQVRIQLKTRLPNQDWLLLSSVTLPRISDRWEKYSATLVPNGENDRVVFEVKAVGGGHLWVDKLSLMPTDNLSGWRKDAIQAIKEMRPAIIRWGGSVCDPGGYKWKEGIGKRDQRVPFPNKVWGRIDPNVVGIDEFCQFCELTGAKPLVCVSFADGPQSAADLVQYCNGSPATPWGAQRSANGHAGPYQVKYWQIGNEIADDDNYAKCCAEFCKAMKQSDPDVALMASFPSQLLLEKAGSGIDYIGPHHYAPDLAACDADFNKLTQMIRTIAGCSHIKIAVTEWNVSGGNFGVLREKFMTLETALLNARYLNLLMRHSDRAEVACRSNMANSLGSGVIETSPSGLLKRPSYYAMKLYAEHAKPIPLAIAKTPEGVDLMACRSEDGRAFCLFAVNMKTEPVEVQVDLSEFDSKLVAVGGELLCDTRDQRQPDVMNHWNAPMRVRTVKFTPAGQKVLLPAFSAAAVEYGN